MSLTKLFVRLGCVAGLASCGVAMAQTVQAQFDNQAQPVSATRQIRSGVDPEKNSRVGAPAEQIRVVLIKNPGLLVELERLVEKEALSKGQLVEDADLTQQAIFDRLDEDVAFRATATRLLQRYGYLLPNVNPDSELGKQQELLIKERVRRMAKIEELEEAQSLNPPKEENAGPSPASAGNCSARTSTDCMEPAPRRPRNDSTTPNTMPGIVPDAPPNLPLNPSMGNAPVLQAKTIVGGLSSGLMGEDADASLRVAALNASRDLTGSQPSPQDLEKYLALARGSGINSGDDLAQAVSASGNRPNRNSALTSTVPRNGRLLSENLNGDSPQGMIVHKPSPYSDVPSLADLYVQVADRRKPPERFGVNMLTSGARDSDALAMDLPVGPDYVVGPGDGLAIDVWGSVTQRIQRTVDSEGRISLPDYGPVLVSGKSLGDVQQTVQQVLNTMLREVSTDVSLSRLRTVRVYVAGEVAEPGAYDVSSLSSPLNALVAAGGLTERGSLRSIKHYRGKQLVEEVDAYDLLLRGVGPNQTRLQNGDSLLVPPVGQQVTIEGMVRRPAIYEIRGNTTLEEALDLAGGVLPAAALTHVEVERLVAHENRTMLNLDLSEKGESDATESQLQSFHVQDGDKIHIFPIAPYNQQAIYLQGHVLRPGRYSYTEGMTLRNLIESYSDLLPEPSGKYAEIIRLNPPDYRPTVENFDLVAALSDPAKAPKLQPLDTVRIFSKYDFEPAPSVSIDGEVRNPGRYTTSGQVHFRDAIYLAGGVTTDAAMSSAQIIRSGKDGTLKILNVNMKEALAGTATEDLLLQPRDRIVIHRNIAEVQPAAVYVKGDVVNPGRYPLTSDMHVQDLIRLAGGLKPSADSQTALLAHRDDKQTGDPEVESVAVNLNAVMAGHSEENKSLANGDVLTVRENPDWNDLGATVTLRGEVQHPGTYGIRPGEPLSSVLAKAGGFTSQAYPYGTLLTRKEVRELEMKSQEELVARVKAEAQQLKALPENDQDQKNAKLTAIAQTETTLTQLETHLPVGRVVIHSSNDQKSFERAAEQTPLHSGDVISVPKNPNYVVVQGQVFNSTAVGYVQGRSANWYLSQAGGMTQLADKKASFVIRADGSVLAAKNNRGVWSGDPMEAVLMPGDVIVVPERAPRVGSRNWAPIMQTAQVATSLALAVAYLKP